MALPARKLSVVPSPSSTSVHGKKERIRLPTGAFSDHECPRSPCTRLPRYWTYWSHRGVWTLYPSCSSTARTHCSLQLPDCDARATAPATGFPGTTRGRRKLTVIATHAASTYTPSLRRITTLARLRPRGLGVSERPAAQLPGSRCNRSLRALRQASLSSRSWSGSHGWCSHSSRG